MRSAVIFLHLFRLFAKWTVRRLGARLWAGEERKATAKRSFGMDLADTCERLGPTFIKLGQILSSRPDLMTMEVADCLKRLHNRLAPFDSRLIPGILQEEFNRPMETLFASFDLAPAYSASIAQVHRARLHGGRRVAVKIRRPGLERVVAADFRFLERWASIMRRFPALKTLPMIEALGEFRRAIEEQLDMSFEARNNRRFRVNFTHHARVRFPELVEELCTDRVLTMEYMEGIIPFDRLPRSAPLSAQTLACALHALYKMIFVDGLVHGDMHPGNLFFRRDGEVVLLDLGLVAQLDNHDKMNFTQFFFGMVTNNGKLCAKIVYETASYRPADFDRDAFDAAMCKLVDDFSGQTAEEFEVVGFVTALFDLQRRIGLTGSTNFMMTIVSLLMFEGIAKQVDPTLDFQGTARTYLSEIMYGT